MTDKKQEKVNLKKYEKMHNPDPLRRVVVLKKL